MKVDRTVIIPLAQHRAAYGAVRSIGRAGYRVVISVPRMPRRSPLAATRYAYKAIPCPDPEWHFNAFVEWLDSQLKDDPTAIVFPVAEAVVHACSVLRRSGTDLAKFVMPADEHLAFTLSKFRATQAAIDVGIRTPATAFVRSPGGGPMKIGPAPFAYPFILKWDNYISEAGGYQKGGALLVDNDGGYNAAIAELLPTDAGIIAQQFVCGHGAAAFALRHGGRDVLTYEHKRLHELPWIGGVSTLCEIRPDRELRESAARLLSAIGYTGAAMVEFRKPVNSPPVFLEINGRLWGSVGLALRAGYDFPRAMLELHLHGRTDVTQPKGVKCIRLRNLSLEMTRLSTLSSKYANLGLRPPSRMGELFSLAWHTVSWCTSEDTLWWDDLGPSCLSIRRQILDGLSRLKKRLMRGLGLPPRYWRSHQNTALETRLFQCFRDSPDGGILFLCYGNICRSPYAMARWNEARVSLPELPAANSAGFHPQGGRETPLRFVAAALERGASLSQHRSRCVTQQDINAASIVVVMDKKNYLSTLELVGCVETKLFLLSDFLDPPGIEVEDPYGQPVPAGSRCYAAIDAGVDSLVVLMQKMRSTLRMAAANRGEKP